MEGRNCVATVRSNSLSNLHDDKDDDDDREDDGEQVDDDDDDDEDSDGDDGDDHRHGSDDSHHGGCDADDHDGDNVHDHLCLRLRRVVVVGGVAAVVGIEGRRLDKEDGLKEHGRGWKRRGRRRRRRRKRKRKRKMKRRKRMTKNLMKEYEVTATHCCRWLRADEECGRTLMATTTRADVVVRLNVLTLPLLLPLL